MRTLSKKLTSYLLAGLLVMTTTLMPLSANAAAFAYMDENNGKPTGGEMMADAFLMRPFMLASTVVTTVTFVVMLPFSLLGGNVGESAETLVKEPAAYTFTRPLGEM